MATVDEMEIRVRAVEEEVGGEKLITRHVLTETRRNSDDLAKVLAQLSHMQGDIVLGNAAVRSHGTRLDSLTRDMTLLRSDVTALRRGQEELHVRVDHLTARFDQMQADVAARFDQMQADVAARFGQMQESVGQMQADVAARFGQMQESVAAILAVVAPAPPPAA